MSSAQGSPASASEQAPPASGFPRQHARTQRFTLGEPRSFRIAADGSRVAFLRSRSGTDRSHLLWVRELTSDPRPAESAEPSEHAADAADAEQGAAERIVADPAALLGAAGEQLSAEEQARRERTRESSAGVVGYSTDAALTRAAFALSGRLYVTGCTPGGAAPRLVETPTPVADPRLSPDGSRVAYVCHGTLRTVEISDAGGTLSGTGDRALVEAEDPDVTWGLAEHIAAEEMDRTRGFWWSADGRQLLVARVDTSPVQRWWIADPAQPERAPAEVRYPAAGTPNAEVTLALVGLDGSRVEVGWEHTEFEYLAAVHWSAWGPPLLLVQSRDQRRQQVLTVNEETGRTAVLHTEDDPVWHDLFPGVPAWTPDGRLVRISDQDGYRHVRVDGQPVSGPELHVRSVLDAGADSVLFAASAGESGAAHGPGVGEVRLYRADPAGLRGPVQVTGEPGLHRAVREGAVTVLFTSGLDRSGSRVRLLRDSPGHEPGEVTVREVGEIACYPEEPLLRARPLLTTVGERRVPSAVVLPNGYSFTPGRGRLPVLLDPYGGPHGQRVTAALNPYLTSQWFADQGFAVVVADGRGTPGRSPGWEKSLAHDFAGVTLQDQVDTLHALAEEYPLDLDRVAIRGWSYGGYLAALAVLRRPDVFHAAVAGAPVTDWRLYDTHYTERYLGHPEENPEVYEANSLPGLASRLERPLMLLHGLADDNVVAAHTLRLSQALLEAGRPHTVLPLSGVTHMTPQEQVAENLLLLQVDFLRRSLNIPE